ncbi:unnamed protein product [Effrenium voratum]|uniref:Uncharacterized protein n=1 Tax=Effrenium voratum TaxID=2562239 RepID=A0AA36IL93_9DINO|nr:unnamed protein product [Effrenium voratum]CAJ1455349.1 unnamed protein product [Effrenium voratum]
MEPGAPKCWALCRLRGLQQQRHLNGARGQLLRPTEGGRWLVRTGADVHAVRAENFSVAAEEVPEPLRRIWASAVASCGFLLLELARSGGTRQLTACLVPLNLPFWALLTLACSLYLQAPLQGPVAPPALGCWRQGCGVQSLLLVVLLRLHQNLVLEPFVGGPAVAKIGAAGYLASFGLGLQSLGPEASAAHVLGNIWFLLGAYCHAWIFEAHFSGHLCQCLLAQSWFFRQGLMHRQLLFSGAPYAGCFFILFVVRRERNLRVRMEAAKMDVEYSLEVFLVEPLRFCQRLALVYIMVYFATYAMDLWIAFEY